MDLPYTVNNELKVVISFAKYLCPNTASMALMEKKKMCII